ncbi:MAG: hypothetical protein ACR2OA_12510 [Rubripirellula sp.]|jgi:hypothetical protein
MLSTIARLLIEGQGLAKRIIDESCCLGELQFQRTILPCPDGVPLREEKPPRESECGATHPAID